MPAMQKHLANEAAMQPAKVYIGEDSGSAISDLHRELRGLEQQKAGLMAAAMQMQLRLQPAAEPPQPALHSGEWVQAVTETIPFLDQAGIYEALSILDKAVLNVQHAKAIESMMAGNPNAATSNPTIQLMQAQVNHSHQLLLQQLMLLRTRSVCAAACSSLPGLIPAPFPGLEGLFEDSSLTSQAEVYAAQEILQQQMQMSLLPSSTQRAPAPASQGLQAQMPSKQPPRGAANRQVQTLSTSLQMLSREDADVLLIVRRINKLGFKAGRRLKQHFSQYGTVIRVLVAHSTCRPSDSGSQARKRPSSLGFIHMSKPQDVAQILSLGPEHEVEGVSIRVQRFERQHGQAVLEEAAAAAAACEEDGLEAAQGHAKSDGNSWWQQSASSKSSASTAASSSLESDSQCDSWPSP